MRISDWSSDVCSSDLRVVGERRTAHVVMNRLALVRKAAAAIRHQAFALRGADRRAEIGLVRGAALALAAFRCVQRNHVIAFLQAFHVGTDVDDDAGALVRSEEHTSELQSLMRISYAVFCLKKT